MVPKNTRQFDDVMVDLAREIAMDIQDITTILANYNITQTEFEKIQRDPRFATILGACVIEWQAAVNTEQRIKFKSAALLEAWLPEANTRLHDQKENLAAKVELAKFLGRMNNLGLGNAHVMGEQGEKFSITINLGAAGSDGGAVKFEKTVAPKVIEHEPGEGR